MTPAPIKKAYIDVPEGQIHYRYAIPAASAPSKIPIVFLHKSASSSISYVKLIDHFSALGYICYAPDMPGFGNSFDPDPSPTSPYTTTYFSSIYVAALTALGLFDVAKGGFHLMGHHSGAALALEIAALHPEVVKTLTLVGPTILGEAERQEMVDGLLNITWNVPQLDGSHLTNYWNYLIKSGVYNPAIPTANLDLLQREALDHIRAWNGRNQIYGAVFRQDSTKLVKMVKCPTLMLCARDDVLWKYFGNVKLYRPDDLVRAEECKGANWGPDLDAVGIAAKLEGAIGAVA
jgi:pimeloyl-ACP methyl ester carboxylesterase